MRLTTGIDLVAMERIKRSMDKYGPDFLKKILTDSEIEICQSKLASVAGFFAIKEAAAKALGTGIWHEGVGWHDFEISKDASGKPQLSLFGRARQIYQEMSYCCHDVSASHDGAYAIGECIMLADDGLK